MLVECFEDRLHMKFHTDLEGSSFYSVFFLGGGGLNYKTKTLIVFPLMRFNRCLRWFANVWSPYTGVRVKKRGLRFWVLGLRSSLYRHPELDLGLARPLHWLQ